MAVVYASVYDDQDIKRTAKKIWDGDIFVAKDQNFLIRNKYTTNVAYCPNVKLIRQARTRFFNLYIQNFADFSIFLLCKHPHYKFFFIVAG